MVFPKARLVVSAILFLAWIGFLAFLVFRTRNPVILSRPQLNVADLVVLAEIAEKDGSPADTVAVQKVVFARAEAVNGLTGSKLVIVGLSEIGRPHGWDGAGLYIVPLSKKNEKYEVTALPPSPGYPPIGGQRTPVKDRRIYRATPDALEQLKQIGL